MDAGACTICTFIAVSYIIGYNCERVRKELLSEECPFKSGRRVRYKQLGSKDAYWSHCGGDEDNRHAAASWVGVVEVVFDVRIR